MDDQIPTTLQELEAGARRQWRRWVADVADGLPPPPPPAMLEVAAILAIETPGEALDDEAEALRLGQSAR